MTRKKKRSHEISIKYEYKSVQFLLLFTCFTFEVPSLLMSFCAFFEDLYPNPGSFTFFAIYEAFLSRYCLILLNRFHVFLFIRTYNMKQLTSNKK